MLFTTLGPSSLPVVVAQPDERHANRAASVLEKRIKIFFIQVKQNMMYFILINNLIFRISKTTTHLCYVTITHNPISKLPQASSE